MLRLCSLHSSTNEEQYKKLLCNESSHYRKCKQKNMTQPEGGCIALSQIDTLRCQRKELEHKGGQMIRALHILRLAKRHVSGRSDIEQ